VVDEKIHFHYFTKMNIGYLYKSIKTGNRVI